MKKEKRRHKINKLDTFIAKKGWDDFTKRELRHGRDSVKIGNTDLPMPWDEVYTRLRSGQFIEEVIYQYGSGRKICLWAQKEGIVLDEKMEEIVDKEVEVREMLQEVANDNPDNAMTLLNRVNERFPDFTSNVAVFADKLVKNAIDMLDEDTIGATEMDKLASAVQKTTDTVGLTQRHGGGVNINNNSVNVEGFEFVLDVPPPSDVIEVEGE